MKLTLADGTTIPLPSGFSFEMDYHSSFFSDEGNATIPAELPAVPLLLEKLGHPDRLASGEPFVRTMPASLTSGILRLDGQLVVNTIRRGQSVQASLAIDNGSFYTLYSSLTLRTVLADQGIAKDSVSSLCTMMDNIYKGTEESDLLTLFPVAVNKTDDGDCFLMNKPAGDTLADGLEYNWRTVTVGGQQERVPLGYGLAPFLFLDRLLDMLFSTLGWTLELTTAQRTLLHTLVVVHTCADACVRPKLLYADLVPDMTMSELFEWIHCRFHGEFRFRGATVSLVFMEDILSSAADLDLTSMMEDHPEVSLSPTTRIHLSADTSIEGAAPAADTLEQLIAKYGHIYEENETEFAAFFHQDCLVLRLATGQYYEVRRRIDGDHGLGEKVLVGSNAYPHVRTAPTVDAIEEVKANDSVMPMVINAGRLMPYAGNINHRNTTLLNQTTESASDQTMLICRYGGLSNAGTYRFGTTQSTDDTGALVNDALLLTPEGMYDRFWKRYNEILLNGQVTLRATVHHPIHAIATLDMYRLKSYHGQHLLPISAKYQVGQTIQPGECEYLLQHFLSSPATDTVPSAPESAYIWRLSSNIDDVESMIVLEKNGEDPDASHWTNETREFDPTDETVFLGEPSAASEPFRYHRTLHVTCYNTAQQQAFVWHFDVAYTYSVQSRTSVL